MPSFSSSSGVGLEFARCYVEALFDSAFRQAVGRPQRSQWWPHLEIDFLEIIDWRSAELWHNAPPRIDITVAPQLTDEFVWQAAGSLKKLYDTIGHDEIPTTSGGIAVPAPIQLRTDRHRLDLVMSSVPRHTARSVLPFRSWEFIFRDLYTVALVDFLLWLLSRERPLLSVAEVLRHGGDAIRDELRMRQEDPGDEWPSRWHAALIEAEPRLGSLREERAGPIHLSKLLEHSQRFLDELPPSINRIEGPSSRSRCIEFLEEALGALVESLDVPIVSVEKTFVRYMREPDRRGEVEKQTSVELSQRFLDTEYEVVLPLRSEVSGRLRLAAFNLEISSDFPVGRFSRPAWANAFAHFTALRAASSDSAVHSARHQLQVAIAAMSMMSQTPSHVEIGDAFVRYAGATRWGYMGRRSYLPLSSLAPHWQGAIERLDDLLAAQDEMAQRIREAFVHLNRAEVAWDAEEVFGETWQVLELIGRVAAESKEQVLSYLPLCFIGHGFRDLPEDQKIRVVADKYKRFARPLATLEEARSKVLAHRRAVRADTLVLEHYAVWMLSFARQVLVGAAICRQWGAQRPDQIRTTVENAYRTSFHIELPPPKELLDR